MADDRAHQEPDGEEAAAAPDLATVLTGTVRSAALRLPRDRVLPVVYAVEPFPEPDPR